MVDSLENAQKNIANDNLKYHPEFFIEYHSHLCFDLRLYVSH